MVLLTPHAGLELPSQELSREYLLRVRLYVSGRCWHMVRQVLGSDCSASSKLVL